MRYPKAIADEIENVRQAVSLWPADVGVDLDHVIDWVLQFDEPDFGLALRVIRNLSVIGQRDIDRGLRVASSKLMRKALERGSRINGKNTLYAAIGDVGKSGAMVSYHFRLASGVSEENFLNGDTLKYIESGVVENIVLIDDVIGTGSQAVKEIKSLTENAVPLGVKNIFVLTVCGMRSAIEEIEESTKAYTFSAFEYSSEDTAANLDSSFYEGVAHSERTTLLKALERYGQVCYRRQPLGYGGIGALIAFPYNTPNFTLPVVWSDDNEWIPLFRRVRRVNGIAAYQSQFKKAANSAVSEDAKAKREAPPDLVTLFVGGKTDEAFFDELDKRVGLAAELGVSTVQVVGLGPSVASDRLAKMLATSYPRSVFILDDDHPTAAKLHERIEAVGPVVKLTPSFIQLLDTRRIEAEVLPNIPTQFSVLTPEKDREDIERALFRQVPMDRRLKNIRQLVGGFLDDEAVRRFIEQLREKLKVQGKNVS